MRHLIREYPLESHHASKLYSGWGEVCLSQESLSCPSFVPGKALLDYG